MGFDKTAHYQILVIEKQTCVVLRASYVQYEDEAEHYARSLRQEFESEYDITILPPHGGRY